MQSIITNRQLAFILFTTLTTSSVVTIAKTMARSAGHGAWVTLLVASLFFGAIAAIIVRLNQLNEGKTLYEYSRTLTGKYVGTLIGFFYLAYFFLLILYYCDSFSLEIKAKFFPKTPIWVMLLAGIPVYGTVAYKGIRNAGRLAEIVGLVSLVVMVILFISMLFQGTFSFILPLYNPSDTGRYLRSVKNAMDSFSGVEVLFIIPFFKKSIKASKTALFSVLGIGLFYILDVYGCYAMIGPDEIANYNLPFLAAIRLVEYPKIEFMQRIDAAYETLGFMRFFLGVSMLYLAIVELLCKMLPKARRIVVVAAVGAALIFVGSITSRIVDILEILKTMRSMCGLAAMVVIPLVLFLITKVKKREKSNR